MSISKFLLSEFDNNDENGIYNILNVSLFIIDFIKADN